MYVGGGLLGHSRAPAEEEALFYRGYGPAEIDLVAMAYYRYERILTDLAIYAEDLGAIKGSPEEPRALVPLHGLQFLPRRRVGNLPGIRSGLRQKWSKKRDRGRQMPATIPFFDKRLRSNNS